MTSFKRTWLSKRALAALGPEGRAGLLKSRCSYSASAFAPRSVSRSHRRAFSLKEARLFSKMRSSVSRILRISTSLKYSILSRDSCSSMELVP